MKNADSIGFDVAVLITSAGVASRMEPGRKAWPSLSLDELPFNFMLISSKGEKCNVHELNIFLFILFISFFLHILVVTWLSLYIDFNEEQSTKRGFSLP